MRMRQSLHQFEADFREAAANSVVRRERLRREAVQRSRVRRVEKVHKHGTLRFIGLIATILATTAIVTWVMFQVLASVAG
jgi:membrane glycosyltransferase